MALARRRSSTGLSKPTQMRRLEATTSSATCMVGALREIAKVAKLEDPGQVRPTANRQTPDLKEAVVPSSQAV